MKTNQKIKAIQKINRGIFKSLNMLYGFNFEKPFDIYDVKIPFTVNKIMKELPARYQSGARVVVLIHYPEDFYGWRKNRTYAVKITGTGANDFDISFPHHHSGTLDYFSRKSDFNDARRLEGAKVYIIAQSTENLAKVWQYPADIRDHVTRDKKNAGTEKIAYYCGYRYTPSMIVDKSGYHVNIKRDELQEKARALRTEREKAAYCATDNTDKIKTLSDRVEIAKTVIIEHLKVATTPDELSKVADTLSHWRGLGSALSDLDRITKAESEKSFASNATFNRYAESIEEITAKIIAWNY